MSENTRISLLSRKEVEQRTTLARTTIYRKIKENTFPKQIKVSAKRVGWAENEIDRFLANPAAYSANNTSAA